MNTSKLIEALNNCIISCNTCFDACLNESDVNMMVNCVRNDRACAEVCSTTVNLLSSNYPDVKGLVKFCQEICSKCASECEKHEHDHCKKCAVICRECEEACKAYLA